jgi:broad specificity phosphatase PhoE
MEFSFNSTLVLASHGDTELNEDIPVLAKHGVKDAHTLAQELEDLVVSKSEISVWSSPHPCAAQTALPLAKKLGVMMKLSYRLTNRVNSEDEVECCGLDQPTYKGVLKANGLEFSERSHLQEVQRSEIPESDESMLSRVLDLVQAVAKSPSQTVFLFTHKNIVDMFQSNFQAHLEGTNIKFIRLVMVKSLHSVDLVAVNTDFVQVNSATVDRVVSGMMVSQKQKYLSVIDNYQRQIQLRQAQLREQQSAIQSLYEEIRRSSEVLSKALSTLQLVTSDDFVIDSLDFDGEMYVALVVPKHEGIPSTLMQIYSYEMQTYFGPFEVKGRTLLPMQIDSAFKELHFAILVGAAFSQGYFSFKV